MNAIDAVAAGLAQAGAESIYNFPGFHSHEIAEALGMKQISLNERVAYAEAYGSCLAGSRSVVTFKNVGLNVACDAFLHSLLGGVNAGMVVVVTDDTYVVGSQEFQDSRHYFDFYGGLWYEPSSPQQAYEIALKAFALSEEFDVPVVIRLTGSYFASKKFFAKHLRLDESKKAYDIVLKREKYVIHPYYFSVQEKMLSRKQAKIDNYVSSCTSTIQKKNTEGVIVFGARESDVNSKDILEICTLPLPKRAILEFIDVHETVEVLEDGDNYVLEKIIAMVSTSNITGAPPLERGIQTEFTKWSAYEDIFGIINKALVGKLVAGDITQFTVETTDTIQVALSLGTAVGTAIGMAGVRGEAYAIVGDTSFLHEGRGVLEEARRRGLKIGVIVIDNGMSWCTGGQIPADSIDLIMDNCAASVDVRDQHNVHELQVAMSHLVNSEGVHVLRILVPRVENMTRQ